MQITFLIGNGFDMQIGLVTDYNSFYKEYCKSKESDSEVIKTLKDNISGKAIHNSLNDGKAKEEPINWSDLEQALGKYTSHVKTTEDWKEIFFDINNNLKSYLKMQEGRTKLVRDTSKQKIVTDFSDPSKYLDINASNALKLFLKDFKDCVINIIDFNYTRTIETLIEYKNSKCNISHLFGLMTDYTYIHHIHGTLDDYQLIFGVDNDEQIANENFKKNGRIKKIIVKPEQNDLLDNQRNFSFEHIFDISNVFILFGLSMGATDEKWWKLLKERIQAGCYIIIFVHKQVNPSTYLLYEARENYRDWFMKRLGIDINDSYRQHILISFSDDMFKINDDLGEFVLPL